MLSTFLKLPFVIKICVCLFFCGHFTQVLLYSVKTTHKILSIFEWPFYTGFTVVWNYGIPGLKIKECIIKKYLFSNFLTKTYVVGTQKKCLNEMVLLSTQNICLNYGAKWLCGTVLDYRPRGREFEPHRCHCVVSLSKTHLSLLSTGSTQEDQT